MVSGTEQANKKKAASQHAPIRNAVGSGIAPPLRMDRRTFVEAGSFAAVVALTRFAFRSRHLYDFDSVNFAFGMRRFDPTVLQPHPPGYFLYILAARLVDRVVHDANTALVALSILASCATVALIYLLAQRWFSREAARAAALVYTLSPLAWFHGIVALTYAVEGLFSALVGYLCWQSEEGRHSRLLPAAVVLGIAAGVRPSGIVLLAPLFLYVLRRATPRIRVAALGLLAATLAAAFIPAILSAGGAHRFFGSLFALWKAVPGQHTIFNSSPINSLARALTILFILFLSFGAFSLAAFIPAVSESRATDPLPQRAWRFTLVWCLPALCMFTFIYLLFVNSGYLMILIAPGCIWIGALLSRWYAASTLGRPAKAALIAAGACANIAIFLAAPLYCSYASVRHSRAELEDVNRTIRRQATPADTLIIAFDSHFLGFRHAGYYLPEYEVVVYPEVRLSGHPQVFAMNDRDTTLRDTLPTGCRTRFLLYPLPHDDSQYAQYLTRVLDKLNRSDLQIRNIDGHTFVSGPISELPRLFPHTDATLNASPNASSNALRTASCKQ